MTTGKTIPLIYIQTFVSKVMSLLLNTLSRFVIAFLPRSKCLNFITAVTIHSDFGAQEKRICHWFHFLPFYLPQSDGTGCHDLSFFNVEFKAIFFTLLFTLIKRLFSSSLLSAIRVVSSAYMMLLFLLAVLISACDSSILTFHMMYSAYKLNKQGDSTALSYCFPTSEPVHFSISGCGCCFLICIQVSQEAGKVICYSHLFKNFPQ